MLVLNKTRPSLCVRVRVLVHPFRGSFSLSPSPPSVASIIKFESTYRREYENECARASWTSIGLDYFRENLCPTSNVGGRW